MQDPSPSSPNENGAADAHVAKTNAADNPSADDSLAAFATLLQQVRKGDEEAIATLWDDYYQQMVRVAAKRLPANLCRTGDEEDVALSAFHSFIAGVRRDQFPDLSGPDNLWGLLITLTGRKVHAHLRHHLRQKRGGGAVRGESVFLDLSGEESGAGIGGVSGDPWSAEIRAELSEACDHLLNQLGDDQLRQIAVMRMDGFLVDEIAKRLEVSKRAVERRLQLIRRIWSEQADEDRETPSQ